MGTVSDRGFTIPELLAFIGIVGIIVAATFLTMHPKNYDEANRNTERWLAVAQLMQAFNRYQADHGAMPTGVTNKPLQIANGQGYLDICSVLVPKYLKDIPLDPQQSIQLATDTCVSTKDVPTAYVTGYEVSQAADGTVTVNAPYAEDKQHIALSHKYQP